MCPILAQGLLNYAALTTFNQSREIEMGDLRSQLLKAGLVSTKQVKVADAGDHKRRKIKHGKARHAVDPEVARRKQELRAAQEQDRDRQSKVHAERERRRQEKALAERRAGELAEQGRRVIATAAVALDEEAEHRYQFVEGDRTVRSIPVSEAQRLALSQGDLGVARPHANIERYVLVPREAGLKLREICPEKLLLLHDPGGDEDEFDGLMW